MGERKVLNKYIPADFDPSLVPRGKKLSAKDGTVPVRMMLPFSVQCDNCHTFLYRGRKFNSKKEAMGGPNGKYLGITRWRFYIKCTHCSRPLTFLTDPKNADYEMESGGTRNYEIQKDKVATEDQISAEREKEEKEDPMKALENRVLESQSEMADLDNLEEIKAMNARHVKLLYAKKDNIILTGPKDGVNVDESSNHDLLTAEDEALIKSIQFKKSTKPPTRGEIVRRLDEQDEWLLEEKRRQQADALELRQRQVAAKVASDHPPRQVPSKLPMAVIKRKRIDIASPTKNTQKDVVHTSTPTGNSNKHPKMDDRNLSSLLGGYGSDSSS
jgi:RNase P subunit RPR2